MLDGDPSLYIARVHEAISSSLDMGPKEKKLSGRKNIMVITPFYTSIKTVNSVLSPSSPYGIVALRSSYSSSHDDIKHFIVKFEERLRNDPLNYGVNFIK